MTSTQGFIVLRQVVSQALVQALGNELGVVILESKPTVCREKYKEYQVPPLGYSVRDEFSKNTDGNRLAPLFYPNPVPRVPSSINVGVFHQTDADPSKLKTANAEEVYVTIAITDLGEHNGWFTFYEGSHSRQPPLGPAISLNLKEGDAVAWSGKLVTAAKRRIFIWHHAEVSFPI
ncbi:unnamed protein product [Aspergillus niger]|nr:unnamed protein product [Aspergillus niger]